MVVQILAQQVVLPDAVHFYVSPSLKVNSKALPQIADTFSKKTINEQTNKTRIRFEDHI
jgi:cobalamin biosynthesis protein CbiG